MTTETRRAIVRHLTLYTANLCFNALAVIAALSYVPITKDFVMGRGWRTFTELFGGFGGVAVSFGVMLVVVGIVVYAVNAQLPRAYHRWIAGIALVAVIVLAAVFGRSLIEMLFAGNTAFIVVFMAIVAVESAAEWWYARRKLTRVTNSL